MRASFLLKKASIFVLAGFLAACQTAQGPAPAPATSTAPAVEAAPLPAVAYAPETAVERGFSALVLNASTGEELYAVDADAPRYPASLSKMMTLYLLFEAVSEGRYSLSTPLSVSAKAASEPPAKIGLKAGSTITVEEAARALAVKSANDVAIVVAENLAGSEAAFARQMTSQARALGLSRTRFVNATGLPDPAQVSSARDMAVLGLTLKRRFPQYASYYRAKSFSYNGRTFRATNNLVGKVAGVDGLKTGYIRMSGYNLVATANRGGKRLIVVVMGGASEAARDKEVTRLIEAYS
ncbi:D-alanyl-D-alanine carboxypeptidase 1, S11 family protein [Stappia aggregata IAM 12614]|uniref:D-alanyl-D-alanine carboxypeptidase 1, S11 family protein n=1 Tax=Roseibium aggregatum (strain ATCC 25650 / DSM 13394 / JCM 20685 / NBRC 16684 / NCIMB 2208 / IAM 12614 / B1) TaxID=384765 RepID=A0NVH8_ROSAI|nr:D-alanyl-D-alanine carboxypeptidase family protein [Roseibium aggregatum]EAV42993.1 D-alanyl-D-alanine carboxypeptidase 1, S11 family protein [Stappia aggregata IAM 12614] [Roseibium aggregatum IAM 12614]